MKLALFPSRDGTPGGGLSARARRGRGEARVYEMEAAKRNLVANKDEAAGTLFIVQVQGDLDDSLKFGTVGRGPHLCLIALSGCLAQGKGEGWLIC